MAGALECLSKWNVTMREIDFKICWHLHVQVSVEQAVTPKVLIPSFRKSRGAYVL